MCFKVIAESIEKEEDDTLLKCLIDTCESAPKFLRLQLDHILDLCMKVSCIKHCDYNIWFILF